MEEDMQQFWSITLYYFKKDKSSTEMQKKICAVYREGAMTDWMCQKWFAKFLGTTDVLVKSFFAVGLSHALEDV